MRASLSIDVAKRRFPLPKSLYGVFLEEINHAGDGGLYAELIRNRSFADGLVPEGVRSWYEGEFMTGTGFTAPCDGGTTLPGWEAYSSGGSLSVVTPWSGSPRNPEVPHQMRLDVLEIGRGRTGVYNSGYFSMAVRPGQYRLTVIARCANRYCGSLEVSLEHPSGYSYATTTVTGLGDGWRRFEEILDVHEMGSDARLFLRPLSEGTIFFDYVSLFPRDTYGGRRNGMRKDLVEMIKDLNPSFLRFPGGCVVEGITLSNAFHWKQTIGPVEDRPGLFNLWGYRTTHGIGLHEYYELCEDLGASAMYVVNCGLSCQYRKAEYADEAMTELFLKEALDGIEYAIGSKETEWGAVRASNGHPEPFDLKYVEIGNEQSGEEYQRRYRLFAEAISRRYPDLLLVANSEPIPEAQCDIVDEHFYCQPSFFPSQFDRYGSYERGRFEVYVGEYACNSGVGQGNLAGAVSEAVFLIGLEENADVVTMSSYAPLLCNVNDRKWPVNLICFDGRSAYGIPSYHLLRLFSANRCDYVVHSEGSIYDRSLATGFYATAGVDEAGSDLVVKAACFGDHPVVVDVSVDGGCLEGEGEISIITSSGPKDENCLSDPDKVRSVSSHLSEMSDSFELELPPFSIALIKAKIRS